ncbi:DoxX family membrane protein [Chryseobacterium sp. H3056]|uniref:DoxX family membrane protein n=1 Tax=Kaistella daneshvariae TaxID=2487074 RepID=A0A3N0WXN8_9FLAO|nr:DoxX family membrane protein [Kaistella daneshvariae]ROI09743.1 DoxX family membrane protein [Kaistella daneshvariae]
MTLEKITKSISFDYFIIVIRFLLAIVFIQYGYSKLNEQQFGLTDEMLEKPLKDLDLMQIGWYLFDHQPFKYFIGISQIICGLMLLINRTVLIGALLFLPIAVNIIIIDLTIMPEAMGIAFAIRLGFYIFLDLLIFYRYKSQTLEAFKSLTKPVKLKFNHKLWTFVFIPLLAFFLEFATAIPKLIFGLVAEPEKTINGIKNLFHFLQQNF